MPSQVPCFAFTVCLFKSSQGEIPSVVPDNSITKSIWYFISTKHVWWFSCVPLKIFLFLHYFVPSAWATAWTVISMHVVYTLFIAKPDSFHLEIFCFHLGFQEKHVIVLDWGFFTLPYGTTKTSLKSRVWALSFQDKLGNNSLGNYSELSTISLYKKTHIQSRCCGRAGV